MERLEQQILKFLNVFIPHDYINIALVKKCKTVDVPAVNSAIGNIHTESSTEICGIQRNGF